MRRIGRAHRLRGERLTAGISLSNEMDEQLSQLRIIDPDVEEPPIELGEREGGAPDQRLRVSADRAANPAAHTGVKPAVLDL